MPRAFAVSATWFVTTASGATALQGQLASAAAFVAFAETRADYTLLEVGLGGRLDATNIVEPRLCLTIP